MPDRSASLLVLYNTQGKILLQHRDMHAIYYPGFWGFFGGGIETGESPSEALQREIREELELEMQDVPLFQTYTVQEDTGVKTRHLFLAPTNSTLEEIKQHQHEGSDAGFFSQEDVKKLKINPYTHHIFDDIFREVYQRVHHTPVILFATGNAKKFSSSQVAFEETSYKLEQLTLDIPEIQSTDVETIAKYSAEWACTKLGEPVVVTDAGYFIHAINGFPGPFIKHVNHWFTPHDYLKLMSTETDRRVEIRECLAFARPHEETIIISGKAHGKLAKVAGKPGHSAISALFIPDGFDIPETEIDEATMVQFWNSTINLWPRFVKYLQDHQIT